MSRYGHTVEGVSEETLVTLTNALNHRAEEYTQVATQIAYDGGKDWRLRAVHQRSMAQALYTLIEELHTEWTRTHGN